MFLPDPYSSSSHTFLSRSKVDNGDFGLYSVHSSNLVSEVEYGSFNTLSLRAGVRGNSGESGANVILISPPVSSHSFPGGIFQPTDAFLVSMTNLSNSRFGVTSRGVISVVESIFPVDMLPRDIDGREGECVRRMGPV